MQDTPSDPAAAKAELRQQAAIARKALVNADPEAPARLAAQSDIIMRMVQDERPAGVVAAYMPIRSELSPLRLVAALVAQGIVTAMPETPSPGHPLIFRRWAPGDDLVDGPYGTSQPSPAAPVMVPRVILAPMLAFDSACWRLGYGGGFYDRTLAGLRDAGQRVTAIGIAFDGQLVDKVPVGPFDMPLDAVLTPSGLRAGATQDHSS
ncbi:MAG: 5-formyltetrahydrofolate cyclo-ligase [Alphaproteobacteria bacterium]|jgi:5-formyltetrahydrofolate cyclo-ligase|nr:5-formyltetrahydrofolate cyclo-ligase [Alphaproteobacteria bacterium]